MSRRSLVKGLLIAAAVLLVIATLYFYNLPRTLAQHDTIVLGESRFPPGSQAALRVLVRDHRDASPLPNATIKLSLQAAQDQAPIPLYTGQTDASGNAAVSFRVPENVAPDQQLIVETTSSLGSDRVTQPVKIERAYRILLTTDKPIYQPGQVIHLRALALSTSDRTPAAKQALEFVIADGKGNKVFRQTQTTSDYGVASADFQLATEVNTGPYNITAQIGDTSSEKTVDVKPYVLPKFAIELTTDRTFYQPGEVVRGSLSANYFFGKPTSGAQIALGGYTFDVERTIVVTLTGTTDSQGNFAFDFALPTYIAGSDLEEGDGRFYLQASVTDQAQHTEVSNLSLPVAQQPIVIRAIPESGQFRSGVENILYVMTGTPAGVPLETELSIELQNPSRTLSAHTDPYGLAEVRLTPESYRQDMVITAKAVNGSRASRTFRFTADYYTSSSILLRPDKPVYAVGESMQLDIFAAKATGTVYLDIVRDGQTASTRAVPLSDGRAQVTVDLTPDLYGTLELHAYQITSDGRMTRDTRLVIVNAANDLNVALKADREVYRPGDQAGIDIRVNGLDGSGVQSAIGLAIVDESVFALADQDPGFARLYFLLEQELLAPKYEVHGFSLARTIEQPAGTDRSLQAAQWVAAEASLAEALVQRSAFSLATNTHYEVTQRAYTIQGNYFSALNKGLLGVSLVLAGAIVWYGGLSLHRRKRLMLSFVLVLIAGVSVYAVMRSQMYSLTTLVYVSLALSIPIGLLVLVVLAVQRKDRALRRAVGFMGLYLLLLIAIFFTLFSARTSSYDIEWLALLGGGLVLLTFFMLLASEVASGCGTQVLSLLVA
ncbi:MAG TPA: MG2 domain-containing protein, partial [Anaerolineae bacterium]|nr:MG2 domain-containing protein [Anaerolineae bacterium]